MTLPFLSCHDLQAHPCVADRCPAAGLQSPPNVDINDYIASDMVVETSVFAHSRVQTLIAQVQRALAWLSHARGIGCFDRFVIVQKIGQPYAASRVIR